MALEKEQTNQWNRIESLKTGAPYSPLIFDKGSENKQIIKKSTEEK
jgi:hypothetical protein